MRFRFKIALCIAVVISLAFALGGSMILSASFNSNFQSKKNNAVNLYQMMRDTLGITFENQQINNYNDIITVIQRIEKQNNSNLKGVMVAIETNTIYQSGVVPYKDNSIITEELDENICITRISKNNSAYYLQTSGLILFRENEIFLDAVYDIFDIYALSEVQIGIYKKTFAAVVALSGIIGWFIAAYLTRSLNKLSDAAIKIAAGELSYRAKIQSDDEFEMLAGNFNHMADEIEKNIEELKDAMLRQEKFMGSFAHEMKTPMTSIIGYADLLRGQSLNKTEIQESSNYIFTEGRRLERLSFKLLDLIVLKKRDFEMKNTSVADLISSTVKAIKPRLNDMDFSVTLKCEQGFCMLEPDLVKSVLINLIDNAVKAAEKNGEIIIESAMTKSGCKIKVSDNGRGIPRDEIEKITQAFYRVDKSRSRAQGGAGLGLTLCAEIAAAHNGNIGFESEQGVGTSVSVTLNGGRI